MSCSTGDRATRDALIHRGGKCHCNLLVRNDHSRKDYPVGLGKNREGGKASYRWARCWYLPYYRFYSLGEVKCSTQTDQIWSTDKETWTLNARAFSRVTRRSHASDMRRCEKTSKSWCNRRGRGLSCHSDQIVRWIYALIVRKVAPRAGTVPGHSLVWTHGMIDEDRSRCCQCRRLRRTMTRRLSMMN